MYFRCFLGSGSKSRCNLESKIKTLGERNSAVRKRENGRREKKRIDTVDGTLLFKREKDYKDTKIVFVIFKERIG